MEGRVYGLAVPPCLENKFVRAAVAVRCSEQGRPSESEKYL